MKRAALKRSRSLKRTKLRVAGHSTTAELKRDIQALLREIVIKRDGGCYIRSVRRCNQHEKIVLQADHLITRANSATYADSRLVVCVCSRCHLWKKWHKEQYDEIVHLLLPKDRSELWDICQKDSWIPKRTTEYDWKMAKIVLEQELRTL